MFPQVPGSSGFFGMASRPSSKGKDRAPVKRGTSVMSEPAEALGGRSCKYQRSHSSSLADYDDLQSTFTEDTGRDEDDDMRMTPSPTPSDEPRGSRSGRQNHSEIEKRRRDKMNTYITELSRVVPMCITMSHKLDKLTVLRMAVQHLKTIRGAIHSYTEGDYKPSFLSDEELKRLILQSADGFLFVVGCDRGRILYVSESVSQVLNYSQGDLLGQSWFDILHPKDVAKVKEQLSSSDLSPRERLIDAKTMLPVKTDNIPQGLPRLCPGARRSFFCRMKSRAQKDHSSDANSSSKHRKTQNVNKEKKYVVIHCTGYLKSWAPAKIGLSDQDSDGDVDACNLSCLVAVGRVQPSILTANFPHRDSNQFNEAENRPRPPELDVEFISRHTIDGKFIFVDQRATLLLSMLPQELLGTSMYEYYHVDDIVGLTEAHKAALQSTETITTPVYRFRVKEGTFVRLQSRWKSFRNPWTKDIEFLVAKNIYIAAENADVFNQQPDASTTSGMNSTSTRVRLMNVEVEASKIGQTVAEEVMDSQRSRSQSSTTGISPTTTNRSPGSIISPGTINFQYSDSQSEADKQTGLLQAPFSNEEMRRSSMSDSTQSMQSLGMPMSRTEMHFEAVGTSNGDRPANQNGNRNQMPGIISEAGLHADENMMEVLEGLMLDQSRNASREGNAPADGNDEAAMAVVMSLLEADAGLGGPVDFSGLPWPLP